MYTQAPSQNNFKKKKKKTSQRELYTTFDLDPKTVMPGQEEKNPYCLCYAVRVSSLCTYGDTHPTNQEKKERSTRPVSALGEIRDLHSLQIWGDCCPKKKTNSIWAGNLIHAGSFSTTSLNLNLLSLSLALLLRSSVLRFRRLSGCIVLYCMYVVTVCGRGNLLVTNENDRLGILNFGI